MAAGDEYYIQTALTTVFNLSPSPLDQGQKPLLCSPLAAPLFDKESSLPDQRDVPIWNSFPISKMPSIPESRAQMSWACFQCFHGPPIWILLFFPRVNSVSALCTL